MGAPAVVTSMSLEGGEPGGQTVKTYRSDDARAWTLLRSDATPSLCAAGGVVEVAGWPEPTRYVAVQMEDRCGGVHHGQFTLAEWSVFGFFRQRMVLEHVKAWPICDNLGPCFVFAELEEAQERCLAEPGCDGFSFSAATVRGGRGSGCYKTRCRKEEGSWSGRGFGRGTHGYWAKRHGCEEPSRASYVDTARGLEVCGP